MNSFKPNTIIIGHGLAGLTAAYEITKAGKTVLLVDQESEQNIGGQAFWSFGGLFYVDSPQQRLMGIKDSKELAWQDWIGTAAFDREEDKWPKAWAEAYVDFASTTKYQYIKNLGVKTFPIVGWAERGDGSASGHGNSVPRFHITWGTGPGLVEPFVKKAYEAHEKGLLQFAFRHKVSELIIENNRVKGIKGQILKPCNKERGQKSNREVIDEFSFQAENIIIASGGIGANAELVKQSWPEDRLGKAPKHMICGVPDYVDGSMIPVSEKADIKLINRDRMWHYTEGIQNWDPIWSNHAIRILPGPSSIWLDAEGNRFPAPYLPGFDTLGTLAHIQKTGYEYSWFILNQSIIKKEFALSGSEQNPDLTNKDIKMILGRLGGKDATAPVENFKKHGADFIVSDNLEDLVKEMNALNGNDLLEYDKIKQIIDKRDRELNNKFSKDTQINYIRGTRNYMGDKLVRVAKPHKILDKKHGPLIAVKLHLLTRKTLGGIQTDLDARVFNNQDEIIEGLYAAGEASGFGGGGVHGYRALEGTFLGGCIFSGMKAGMHIAQKKM